MKKILFALASFLLVAIPYSGNCQWSLTGNSGTTPGTNFLGTTDVQHLVFKTNNVERMRLLSNGNLLIGGTTDNSYKLDVNGTSWFQNSIRVGSFAITKGVNASTMGVNQGIRIDDALSTPIRFQTSNQGAVPDNFVFENTFGMNRSVYTNASVVRITQGWGNPNTSGYNVATLRIDNELNITSGGYIIRGIYYNPTVTSLGTSTHIAFENTVGNNRFNSSGGNTLIGTSTDDGTNKLQVNGGVKASAIMLTTGAGAGKVLTSDGSGNATWETAAASGWAIDGNTAGADAAVGTNDNYALLFKTNNTTQMRLTADGKLGIGTGVATLTGTYKLYVEDGIRARKVRVDQSSWSDYVFYPEYRLRPLGEVEQYIKEQKHLPEVPSAAEVQKEGIDLGDNQALLLKKIEELTLYIIEQNKRMDQMQKQIQQLQKRSK